MLKFRSCQADFRKLRNVPEMALKSTPNQTQLPLRAILNSVTSGTCWSGFLGINVVWSFWALSILDGSRGLRSVQIRALIHG